MLFNGEVAIITGAAKGIGEQIARTFCREGARAAVFDLDANRGRACADAILADGGDARFFSCDVTSLVQIQQAIQDAANHFGRIDILVNNAGILHTTPIEQISEAEWDRIMAVNLKSVFFMTQQVLPYFKEQRRGSVLNVSSLAGRMGGYANGLGYTASKAGIIGLTYGLARRLAADNITVNAIAPGTTSTDIISQISPQKLEMLKESIPLKRLGTTQDIANAAVFLTSPNAGFITGAVLDINGGIFTG